MLTPYDGRRTTDKKRSQKLTMSTLCSGELKTSATKNVASRVLTRLYYTYVWKNAPPPTKTIFVLIQDFIRTNLIRKNALPLGTHVFQIGNKYFTIAKCSHIRKNDPSHGSHVFQPKVTVFKVIQDIIGTNLLTKFHEDRKKIVASRVLTMFYNSHIMKNAPLPGGHVFQPTGIIFELVQDIIGRIF
ncbi:hypothetical protein DPMN_177186 [Dreissena polymorpha]|uniref:Uncharacterized protein n=1 Tax=Dreissena polymorpha TaxID=45954 RepID=A0A9D4E8B6_DREPO|nr:hypothetical protein DPMN_177186 [Dreissena polymorpha]